MILLEPSEAKLPDMKSSWNWIYESSYSSTSSFVSIYLMILSIAFGLNHLFRFTPSAFAFSNVVEGVSSSTRSFISASNTCNYCSYYGYNK